MRFVEILIFEVVRLVEIWCGIIYFVRICPEIQNPRFEQNWLRIDLRYKDYKWLGLVEIWCGIIYFVRIGHEMKNPKFNPNRLRIGRDKKQLK